MTLHFRYVSGLSQRDLALSKRAEEQLEMERRDQELAKRLQVAFSLFSIDETNVPIRFRIFLYQASLEITFLLALGSKKELAETRYLNF